MYLFYLDESGEREYTSLSQYFVLCALGVPVEQWRALNLDVLNLKRTYFNRSMWKSNRAGYAVRKIARSAICRNTQ